MANQYTYAAIPPPPLPEFYLGRQKEKHEERALASSSSSTTDDDAEVIAMPNPPAPFDGAYDGRKYSSQPFVTFPPPPPIMANAYDVPPLKTFHICRLCRRTRSPRFHREHPIPINGVVPPPGICKRCRIAPMSEIEEITEVVVRRESNDIKLGFIQPFTSTRGVMTNEEFKQLKAEERAQRDVEGRKQHRSKSRSRTILCQDYQTVDQAGRNSTRRARTILEPDDAVEVEFPLAPPTLAPPTRAHKRTTTSMKVQPTEHPPSMPDVEVNASTSSSASSSAVRAATTDALSKQDEKSASRTLGSSMRQLARQEVALYDRLSRQPSFSESDIRRISREETQRYRQAERMMEDHGNPFAHRTMKLVPVEDPVIEIERDDAEIILDAKPIKDTGSASLRVQVDRDSAIQAAATNVDHSATGRGRKSNQKRPPAAEKVGPIDSKPSTKKEINHGLQKRTNGPKWRREMSLERQHVESSNGSSEKAWNIAVKESTPQNPPAAGPDIERPVQVPRGIYEAIQTLPRRPAGAGKEPRDITIIRDDPKYDAQIVGMIGRHLYPEAVNVTLCEQEPADSLPEDARKKFKADNPEIETETKHRKGLDRSQRELDKSTKPATRGVQPEPPLSERLKQLNDNLARQQQPRGRFIGPQVTEEEQGRYSRSTFRTDRDYWYDNAVAQTVDSRSSQPEPLERNGSLSQHSANAATQQDRQSGATLASDRAANVGPKAPAEATYWREGPDSQYGKDEPNGPRPARNLYTPLDTPGCRIRRPGDSLSNSSSGTPSPRGHRPGRDESREDREYIFAERIIQPADRPTRSRPFDGRAPAHVELEETVYLRKVHRSPSPGGRRGLQEDRVRERQDARVTAVRDDRDSNHVRFSSKVDVSPTPPGSDASSSAFRSFHSFGRRSDRQIDGHESAEELIEEYERRGRERSRDPRSTYDDRYRPELQRAHARDRDETVKPPEGTKPRQYDGRAVRLDRALSESPSREGSVSDHHEEAFDGRGPYRRVEKPTDSMFVEDGRRDEEHRPRFEHDDSRDGQKGRVR